MAYIYLCLAGSFLLIPLCTSTSIGDSHICSISRLVRVPDPRTWNCFEDYPKEICQRIRLSDIDTDIFTVQTESVCCPGWTRDDDSKELICASACERGFYGQDCKFECGCIHEASPGCNPVNGSCDCLNGFMDQDCDKRCSPGFYGSHCRERSQFICKNDGINHPDDGRCLCPSQFHGSRCETRGTKILDCEDYCILNNTENCDTIAGVCRCCDGWKPPYCAEPCEIGKKGQFCQETCCSGRGHCINESCICADGYHGDECQHKCEDGTFGRNCKGTCLCPLGRCDHVTGACDECPPGFKGDRCTDYCSLTQWGPTCNQICSCEEEEICDIFTGKCFPKAIDTDIRSTTYPTGLSSPAIDTDIRSTTYPTGLSSPGKRRTSDDSLYPSPHGTATEKEEATSFDLLAKKHGLPVIVICLLPALLVFVVCGTLHLVCIVRRRCKKTRRLQNGYSTPLEGNSYLTILDTPTQREQADISDGQTYITRVASSTGSSTTTSGQNYITRVASSTGSSTTTSGYSKPSEGTPKPISHRARTRREESVTSDGYSKPSDGNLKLISHRAKTLRGESVTSDGYSKPSEVNSYSSTICNDAKRTFHREESTNSSGGYVTTVCSYAINEAFEEEAVSNGAQS